MLQGIEQWTANIARISISALKMLESECCPCFGAPLVHQYNYKWFEPILIHFWQFSLPLDTDHRHENPSDYFDSLQLSRTFAQQPDDVAVTWESIFIKHNLLILGNDDGDDCVHCVLQDTWQAPQWGIKAHPVELPSKKMDKRRGKTNNNNQPTNQFSRRIATFEENYLLAIYLVE